MNKTEDSIGGYPELMRYLRLFDITGLPAKPNSTDNLFGKFGIRGRFSKIMIIFFRDPKPLVASIQQIVERGPKKKVVRADTRWIVATMAYVKAIRDWTIMQLPRISMGETATTAAATLPEPSVPFTIATSRPCPAHGPRLLIDVGPKPNYRISPWSSGIVSQLGEMATEILALRPNDRLTTGHKPRRGWSFLDMLELLSVITGIIIADYLPVRQWVIVAVL